jgi:uncharacterized protein (DUF58 family)
MSTSGIAGWLNIHSLDCRLLFPDEVYSTVPTLATIKLSNRKQRIPSFLLKATLQGTSCTFISVAPGATVTSSFTHTVHGRGRHPCGSAVISSPFPVNFFIRGVEIRMESELIAFPCPIGDRGSPHASSDAWQGEIPRTSRGHSGDLAAIADYSGAEPLKQIHWRLSARHDWFKVKESGDVRAEPVIIDLTLPDPLPREQRLSRAAYHINRLSRSNCPVGLKMEDGRMIAASTGRSHRLRLLNELALS